MSSDFDLIDSDQFDKNVEMGLKKEQKDETAAKLYNQHKYRDYYAYLND